MLFVVPPTARNYFRHARVPHCAHFQKAKGDDEDEDYLLLTLGFLLVFIIVQNYLPLLSFAFLSRLLFSDTDKKLKNHVLSLFTSMHSELSKTGLLSLLLPVPSAQPLGQR